MGGRESENPKIFGHLIWMARYDEQPVPVTQAATLVKAADVFQ